MNSEQLNTAFNESELVLCRSGYTTVLDLAKLEKKAFFIPTPGQFEQEYLAKKYTKEGIAPSCNQDDFKLAMLSDVAFYKGFTNYSTNLNYKEVFDLFKFDFKNDTFY
jgi:UDP-N-acetylglucosamine:LPS N-acetylglucosamine transferase